jgi:hypothetical protein
MQGYPQAQGPAGGLPPTQGVPQPGMPPMVAPGLTQYPAPPMTGYPPPGFPAPPPGMMVPGMMAPGGPYGQVPGTYPGAPQPYYRVPGPAALGAAPPVPGAIPGAVPPQGGAPAPTGGVAGVSMAPVGTVAPPAGPGGPHPLPPMPGAPLPQGFPNPFALQQMPWSDQGQPGAQPVPQQPGMQSVTGPMGYLPGLGYFPPPTGGAAGSPPPTAFPVLPGNIQGGYAPGGYAPAAPQPQPQLQAPPPQQTAPPPPAPAAAGPNPFWLQLAWQLVQTPAVKAALGDRFQGLLESEDRMRTLQIAAACLTGPDLQNAFKALTAGNLDQSRFTELFAEQVQRALQSAGLATTSGV